MLKYEEAKLQEQETFEALWVKVTDMYLTKKPVGHWYKMPEIIDECRVT